MSGLAAPIGECALRAADVVLLVTEAVLGAVEALARVTRTLEGVRADCDGAPRVLGVVVSNYTARESYPAQLLAQLREQWPVLGVVPRRAVMVKAEGAGGPAAACGAEIGAIVEEFAQLAQIVTEQANKERG
ncbi:hypothetical protein [Allobranchiibius huperziae]|uniref:Cellulose biosynthesis protein BcsQ n=1 Tax=Allobranchiibius huperziae TaxID=1874116 RepID=A0A853DM47_9MICO|nr:hypothetical protein [Allobranchiibius huperziae]NYJ75811.1 cellulose biosynthesis protein BcsQ [Allobranchiibius huperziae]